MNASGSSPLERLRGQASPAPTQPSSGKQQKIRFAEFAQVFEDDRKYSPESTQSPPLGREDTGREEEYDFIDDNDDGEEIEFHGTAAEASDSARQVLLEASTALYELSTRTLVFGDGPIGISFNGCGEFPEISPPFPGALIMVTRVFEGTQASRFGLQEGDVIVGLNGQFLERAQVQSTDDFYDLLADTPRPVTITFRFQVSIAIIVFRVSVWSITVPCSSR